MSTQAVKVRASSLGELFDCSNRWAAKYLDGLFTPSTPKAVLGKAVHASTAAFDKAVMESQGMTVDEAAAAAVDEIFNSADEVDWDQTKPQEVESVALSLHKKYCTQVAPFKKYVAVEVTCDSLHLKDLDIILTGTADRIGYTTPDKLGVIDIKTGQAVVKADGSVETKGHSFQIGTYELIGAHASGFEITGPAEIIGMQNAKTEKGQRIGSGVIYGAREILLGTDKKKGILQRAAEIIHSGSFYGNPKSMMCSPKYCPLYNHCDYRK